MNDHIPFRDQSSQRFVLDFETQVDMAQRRMDRTLGSEPREAVPAAEMEYTTEWQMESGVEEAPCV